ncbi:ATP-binding protein [Sulfuricurvum sp.]|uniref:ATP-dependent nuclease n=1 Tax=Sulfuricurvum sp. TaxID=2025608 RepID=UPI00260BD3BB|nr:ATP-binding protein [Sulfuricurvum sp.]MDD3596756.1 AAA family ATPase [Sulfuricurvum sp.]
MKIIKFKIENFKTFKDVSFEFDKELNILTGSNNSGKTTVLEALALWNECFTKLIKQARRADSKINLQNGQYRLGDTINYFDYNDIVSVRSPNYKDIFFNFADNRDVILTATLQRDHDETLDIAFTIKHANGSNYIIALKIVQNFDYQKFNRFFRNFPDCIQVVYASPVANILMDETFSTDPIIKDRMIKRESFQIVRNRLYNLSDEKLSNFQDDLSFVLSNGIDRVTFNKTTNKFRDVKADVRIKLKSSDIEKNLSLVGSGTLQIIEILLAVYEQQNDMNLILLDEPDSHIHRDIQKRLIQILSRHSSHSQVFMTTHNESLIRSTAPKNLFHLESNVHEKNYRPILHDGAIYNEQGLQPTKQIKVLQALGGESSLDLLNALEAENLIFVEGKNDAKYIDEILSKKYRDRHFNVMYWSFDGIANIFKDIFSYKTLFTMIKNEKTLWEKSILVFDCDFFTTTQQTSLISQLSTKLSIPVFGWNFYTFESVFLTDIHQFGLLIKKYLYDAYTIDEIQAILHDTIVSIIAEKQRIFNTGSTNGELNKWIIDRTEEFNKHSIQNNILPNGTAYHQIITFHNNELTNSNLESLATKDDIEHIIKKVIESFGITIDENKTYFYELLKMVDASTWYDEWDRLITLIENRR